jgi:hypothetical protein
MGTPNAGAAGQLDPEVRADAVDVLRDLVEWRLAPQRWARIEESVDALEAALAAGDVDALRDAVADLELAGPVRATRIGSVSPTCAPPLLLERANHLVHALTTEQAAEQRSGPGGGPATDIESRGADPSPD